MTAVHHKKDAYLFDPDEVENTVLRKDISFEESQRLYNKWAESGTYEDVHADDRKIYSAQEAFAPAMKGLFPDVTSVKVLDAGAGTGLTGEQMHLIGYRHLDALEPLAKFAETCRKRGFYTKVFNQPVSGTSTVPVPDNTYDAVTTVGAFHPGAIPTSAIRELVRIIKPGGYWVNCMREEFMYECDQFKDFIPVLDTLQNQGRVRKIEWTRYPGHFKGKPGIRMIFKVL